MAKMSKGINQWGNSTGKWAYSNKVAKRRGQTGGPGTVRTTRLHIAIAAVEEHAKAEAAQGRLKFAHKEINTKVKQAEFSATQ